MKGFVGLCAGISTQMFCVYHVPNNSEKTFDYLLFITFIIIFAVILCQNFYRLKDAEESENEDIK